jgi:hypothetical protein
MGRKLKADKAVDLTVNFQTGMLSLASKEQTFLSVPLLQIDVNCRS